MNSQFCNILVCQPERSSRHQQAILNVKHKFLGLVNCEVDCVCVCVQALPILVLTLLCHFTIHENMLFKCIICDL